MALVVANLFRCRACCSSDGIWRPSWCFLGESGVIAFYTVLKIVVVGKVGGAVAAPLFAAHFGGFMAVHFLFIYSSFSEDQRGRVRVSARSSCDFRSDLDVDAALAISHGISFFDELHRAARVSSRDCERADEGAPYQRVIVMHLT